MKNEFQSAKEIQWFPGHMTKTLRLMESEKKQVDMVLQLLDARIPFSSLNPEIQKICEDKPKLFVLNKADLADPDITAQWIRYFKSRGAGCVAFCSKNQNDVQKIKNEIDLLLQNVLQKRQEKGQAGAKIRIMLAGIPNVGKSTFINTFCGQSRTQTANRPGVTRGKQWVSAGNYDLLDMPGVLWKKFASKETAVNLAFIGSIKDQILDMEELACVLLGEVADSTPESLAARYKVTPEELRLPPYELLQVIGRKRGMLVSGGEVDTERAAVMFLDEFRARKLGRISLEKPQLLEELKTDEA
ncbi:MAG: ribosome biogenesis GTPase YlqF [Oscillospiraceae bacterium]|nr:ribosome biogenesis GTPase YlqF [Oscillospiraceae bacterium]